MAARELKVSIVGEDKGATKALHGVGTAADKLGDSSEKTGGILGKLRAVLADKLGPAGAAANNAIDSLQGAMGKVGPSSDGARDAVAGLSDGLKQGLVAGAAAGVTALIGMGKTFLDVVGEVDNLQDIIGGTAEEASKLRNIAHVTGTDVDVLGNSMFKLSLNIEKSRDTFSKWGVTLATNDDGTLNYRQTLLNLADAYNAIEDPQQRNVFLMETFGKTGKDLIDILEQGSDKLREFGNSGPVIHERDIERAKEFNQWVEKTKLTLQGYAISVVRAFTDPLAPAESFGAIVDELTGKQRKFGGETKKTTEQLEAESAALSALAGAQVATIDKTLALASAHHAAAEAAADVEGATEKYNEAVREHGVTSREAQEAERSLEGARQSQQRTLVGLAQAVVASRVAQEEANGTAVDGATKAAYLKEALIQVANSVNDPLRSEILALAQNIRDVPGEKPIHIYSTGVEQVLRDFARVRESLGSTPGFGVVTPGRIPEYQSGGWVDAPEGREQLAVLHGGEYVVPADVAKHINRGAMGTTKTRAASNKENLVVEIPLYIDGRKVAEATARFTIDELRRRGFA